MGGGQSAADSAEKNTNTGADLKNDGTTAT
jgi:hypothetical protein